MMSGSGRMSHGDPDWLSVHEALERVLRVCSPLPAVDVPLQEALGRALASDVASRVDHPPWNNSAMDGFAIRADDVALRAPPRAPNM